MRGKKTKKEVIKKVLKKKIEDPEKGYDKIGQELGLPKSTVGDILKANESLRKSSNYKQKLVDSNLLIIQKASEIILKNLLEYDTDKKKIRSIYELERLAEIANKSFSQNKLLDGDENEEIEIKIKLPKF